MHLYRSLLRFYDMPENEIKEMLYLLNTANVDCYGCYHPERRLIESGPVTFSMWLDNMDCRPYRTEVQLHKALMFLKRGVERDMIITAQREALQTLRCIDFASSAATDTTYQYSIKGNTLTFERGGETYKLTKD